MESGVFELKHKNILLKTNQFQFNNDGMVQHEYTTTSLFVCV